jgi:CRISPR-associated protein Csb1
MKTLETSELVDKIKSACEGGVSALRVITKLQPTGGDGDKVFPPTYEGGKYHTEMRLINNEKIEVVVLDSVQSQANRFEEALASAFRAGQCDLPVLSVTIPGHDPVTTLTAPHRIHDAIFRDSLLTGQPFLQSDPGQRIKGARVANATALFDLCPTVLILGSWDSHSGGGVNSAKIPRALTSEIVGLNAQRGNRTASRVDPLGIERGNRTIWKHPTDYWTFNEKDAVKDKGKPVPYGKEGKSGKPSAIGHGNVTPRITEEGGVTISEAVQTTLLSFVQLRRLSFPGDASQTTFERDVAGRAVVAALALYAITLQLEAGYDLRSRCSLLPVEQPTFELLGPTFKDSEKFRVTRGIAKETFDNLREQAAATELRWRSGVTELTPSEKLVELVNRSDKLTEVDEEGQS